jgi:hypothetical protein
MVFEVDSAWQRLSENDKVLIERWMNSSVKIKAACPWHNVRDRIDCESLPCRELFPEIMETDYRCPCNALGIEFVMGRTREKLQ